MHFLNNTRFFVFTRISVEQRKFLTDAVRVVVDDPIWFFFTSSATNDFFFPDPNKMLFEQGATKCVNI